MSDPVGRDAFLAHFDALRDQLPGAGALARARAEALDAFAALGIPGVDLEDWRFTSLKALEALPFQPARGGAQPDRAAVDAAAEQVGPAHRFALTDGVFASAPAAEPEPGVRVRSLAEVAARDPGALESRLGSAADPKTGAFRALNAALFADGALIEIEADVALERPLHLVFTSPAGDAPRAAHPRSLIHLGPGARATVVEHWVGAGDGPLLNDAVTEVLLGRDASLDHVSLQEQGAGTFHIGGLAARQERGSRLASHSISLGARLMRMEIATALEGEGAHSALYGLYLGRGAQLVDHHTTIDHATPHTTSDELYKGVLDERAHGVFHGRVVVRPHAQKISAMQTNRNLLLSDRATINTKPQLEIFANDVRCSHGATIGRLDPDALFYLQTRGVERELARALLTRAFAAEVTSRLPLRGLREHLEARLPAWLGRRVPGGR